MSKDKTVGIPTIGEGKDIKEAIDAMVARFGPIFDSFTESIGEIGRRLEVVEAIPKLVFPDTITVNVVNHEKAELLDWDEKDRTKSDKKMPLDKRYKKDKK